MIVATGNPVRRHALGMRNKIGIESLTGLAAWTTSEPNELGDPHFGVATKNRSSFRHKYPRSTIVGQTRWAQSLSTHPLDALAGLR
jgi:hypothetical protein